MRYAAGKYMASTKYGLSSTKHETRAVRVGKAMRVLRIGREKVAGILKIIQSS